MQPFLVIVIYSTLRSFSSKLQLCIVRTAKRNVEVVEAAPLSDNLCKSTEAIKIGSFFLKGAVNPVAQRLVD